MPGSGGHGGRERCLWCGEPVALAAEPRVGPAPRFVYRCADRCTGERLSQFVVDGPGVVRGLARHFPDVALWVFSRCCP
jgi:hypothetical protein